MHHNKAYQGTTRHSTTRRDAAQSGTAQHNTAQRGAAQQGHRNTARTSSTQQGETWHYAARRTTAHHNTKARDANRGSNQNKPPHTPEGAAPARHTPARGHRTPGNNGGGPFTQTATRNLIPAPRRRKDTETPGSLTQGHTKPPGATTEPAEPEPNPAGRDAEPNVYITHRTHGAGARPGKTQPPTATRKTTLNADQCVHRPREGRRRNRQTPPEKNKRGRGREKGPQPRNRPPTPQEAAKPPAQTAPKTGPPEGAPEDRPAETGNTKPGAAAHWGKGHREHADTHHAGADKKDKKHTKAQPEPDGMGGRRPRDPGPGQPATDTTKPRYDTPQRPLHQKKPKGRGGANPTHGNTRTPPRHRRPPKKGGVQAGHTQERTHTPTTQSRGTGVSLSQAQNARPHSTPQRGMAGYKRGAHTNTHTPQAGSASTTQSPYMGQLQQYMCLV